MAAVDPVRIDAALEARRRLASAARAAPRCGDAVGLEVGDSSTMSVVASVTSVSSAAHDPGDADRAVVGVADQQVVGGERALDAVERRHRLAVVGEAHAEAAAAERVEVERVVRLVELEHHVVGDVDDVADRPHPGARSAAAAIHCGRRAERDARDDDAR